MKKTSQDDFYSAHLLVEFWGCKPGVLNDHDFLVQSLEKAAKLSNATVLNIASHQFTPMGVTAIALLAESHLSIHTWPEREYAAIDVFTCGRKMDPHKTVAVLEKLLKPAMMDIEEVTRGIQKI
jgi:S-adenosylmethionine decarboxylase